VWVFVRIATLLEWVGPHWLRWWLVNLIAGIPIALIAAVLAAMTSVSFADARALVALLGTLASAWGGLWRSVWCAQLARLSAPLEFSFASRGPAEAIPRCSALATPRRCKSTSVGSFAKVCVLLQACASPSSSGTAARGTPRPMSPSGLAPKLRLPTDHAFSR
jgi:hypothetical protein